MQEESRCDCHPGSRDCVDEARQQLPAVADGEEILEFLTGVMRGEGDSSAQTMKAAELLGKRMGLFAERVEPPPAPVIIDDIGDADDG